MNITTKNLPSLSTLLSPPDVGPAEVAAATRAIQSGWVAPLGPELDGFEADLSAYTSSPYVVGLSSGTAAIHLSLIVLGVGKGDVVISPSFTFSGTANPVAYLGAELVFVGSEPTTWNMCPDALEEAIKGCIAKGKRPKAVIVVHLYGMPARLQELCEICAKYDIPVLEDAAESLGATVQYGQQTTTTGTFSDIGILSFNGNKLITTSGGGALLCKSKAVAEKVRFLSTQAKDPAPHYQHSEIGYNYRLSNVLAAVGRAQLSSVKEKIASRRSHFEFYQAHLGQLEGVHFLTEPSGFFANRWLSTILFDEEVYPKKMVQESEITSFREVARHTLLQVGIESRPLWKPLHLQPIFKSSSYYGNEFEVELFKTGLCLPSGSNMSDSQREKVVDVLEGLLTGTLSSSASVKAA
jgi:dTDP-4-amino-4,6-dideoxygalactose transaminase